MHIKRTKTGVQLDLTTEEAIVITDDIGQFYAADESTLDLLYELLDSMLTNERQEP